MKQIIRALLASLLFTGLLVGQQPAPDLILLNGKIFTSNTLQPYVEALAIKDDRIVATGSAEKIMLLAGPQTKRVDLEGRVVIPGINDAHFHLGVEPSSLRLPLPGQDPTWREVENALAKAVAKAPRGTIIRGTIGPTLLEAPQLDEPKATRASLDSLAPNNPVMLINWTGHSWLLNSAGLSKLGVRENEPDPEGGRFVRSPKTGKLTGVVLEFASFRLLRKLSELTSEQEALQQTREFLDTAARMGITSVQNMSIPVGPERCVVLLEKAPTPIRVRIIRFLLADAHGRNIQEGRELPAHPAPLITVSGTKWVLDGTPIERSAAMRQPYADRPSTSGSLNFSEKEMEAMLRESLRNHDQLMVHVAGDRTTETFLQAMEATGGKEVWAQRRVRIEHGDGIMPDLVDRAKTLGVVVVQNPTHLTLHDLLVSRFGPERTSQLQPLGSLLKAGIPVALGSDGPFNPYLNIMLASTYPDKPGEALTREQAVIAYTLTAAYAEFAEKDKGSLEPGKLADLAVLSQDIFTVPPGELPNTESLLTLVGGKVVYDAKALKVH
jgi:predicted amidohydrolase YtcJ